MLKQVAMELIGKIGMFPKKSLAPTIIIIITGNCYI